MNDSDQEASGSGEENENKYVSSSEKLKPFGWGDMQLRPYQLVGVNWMIDNYKRSSGCILGDEMGLGKTCQTIAVIAYVNKQSQRKTKIPNLVVCPRSVLENWGQEINRFAPGLRKQIFIGEKESRQDLARRIKSDYKKNNLQFDVLVTTYEICMKDSAFLQSIPWNLLVVDEAHRLKNLNSLLYKTLSQWDVQTSILLTGTPVQNNLQELYALLSFIAPTKFPQDDYEDFVRRFSTIEKSDKKSKELHKLLKPYLLLRRKTEVLKDLPEKSEVVLTHGISKLQAKLYKGILVKDTEVFETASGAPIKQTTTLMNILMQLRKCVNHPYLFDGVEPEPFVLGEHLVEASGKLVVIDKLLKFLHSTGHKVLMFSQMTHMLDVLQDYLGYRGYTYERLDGSVRGEERFLAVQNFNANDETFVFLLSTKAGGQGINLTSADTVIFVDSDFNPQNDLQAAARAHRIGQSRPVKVIRLIGKNTVEEIILKRAEDKLKLTSAVIKEGEFSLGATKQSLFTDDKVKLQDILKYGVDELLNSSHGDDLDLNFKVILGPTVDGEWQPAEESDMDTGRDTETASGSEDEGIIGDAPQSMYVFEGTDYSKEPTAADVKAFEELLETQRAVIEDSLGEDRPSRLKRQPTSFMAGLPELRKPRKKLTPEELEERKQKRKEAAEKRAKDAEEREMKKAQEARKRRDDLWKKNDYKSCNIEMDDSGDDEDDRLIDEGDDIGDATPRDIHYVLGDVTHPKKTDRDVNIVIHCADDAGSWGRGGIFTALSARSPIPENHYTLAGKMQDLALGDCHLISLDDVSSRPDSKDWLGLIIAQHRDKRNNLSGIKLSALRCGLEKVFIKAKEYKASVHLPRIGHDTMGFNWYGTEKLIKKHLASKGIPTYIYYYPRRQHKRKTVVKFADKPSSKVDEDDDSAGEPGPFTSRATKRSKLLDTFTGMVIFLHTNKMSDEDLKKYKRYIIAYNGDVDASVTDRTTHIVISEHCDTQTVRSLIEDREGIKVITADWLEDSLKKKKLMNTENYEIC